MFTGFQSEALKKWEKSEEGEIEQTTLSQPKKVRHATIKLSVATLQQSNS